jgi:hypothetical protein
VESGADSTGVTLLRPPGHSTVDKPTSSSAVARAPAPCHIAHGREEDGVRARGRKEEKSERERERERERETPVT